MEQGFLLPTPLCSPLVALALSAALRTCPKCWYQKGQPQGSLEGNPPGMAVWGVLLLVSAAAARCRAATNSSLSSRTLHGKAPPGFCWTGVWKLLVLPSFFPKMDPILLGMGAGKEKQL